MNEEVYNDSSSLELPVEALDNQSPDPANSSSNNGKKRQLPKYVIIAIIILFLLALILGGFLLSRGKSTTKTTGTSITINTQSLDNGTLNTLTAKTGTDQPKQQLTISPDTLFINNVDVQQSVTVGTDLSVGDDLFVKGKSTLQGAVGINSNLSVNGALSVGGNLTAGGLSVGNLSATSINLSSNLTIGGHIIPSGTEPSSRTSVAAGGGSISISGNDTSGTITLHTGGSPLPTGELAIITFRAKFSATPKVQLTPVNPAASALDYYVTRSTTFFTLNSSSPTAPGTEYVFDYFVTQ